jgi:hypothetical protein
MTTLNITRPDGTRSAYTNISPAAWSAVQAVKPHKTKRARSEKRLFPQWNTSMSTADYIKAYFVANTQRYKLPAYDQSQDHLALYAPLPDTPAAWFPGVDVVEITETE